MVLQPLSIFLWAVSALALCPDRSDEASGPQIPFSLKDTDDASASKALPVVDLGYAKHGAVPSGNDGLYKFQNIRYAAPPTGKRRFKAPQSPLPNLSSTIEYGWGRKECPQAMIKWVDNFPTEPCDDSEGQCECCKEEDNEGNCIAECDAAGPEKKPPKKLLGGLLPNLTSPLLYSEDCLHLDVWTPKTAFDGGEKKPVLVWIYGGAYIFGGKSLYLPGPLIRRATINDRGGMVFVAMNYRMGALGFAAGRDIADEDLNAGLLDQQQALRWVQDHIEKFGGDPNQVTIAGLSAGGGSVLHHLTAYGGEKEALFRRAISFSGGWQPIVDQDIADTTFREFMRLNGVSSLADLRDENKVSEEQIMKANFDQIQKAPPGSFLYNPTAWGHFAPKSPTKLFYDNKFLKDIDVILSHVQDEGGAFVGAFKEHGTTVPKFVDLAFPNIIKDDKEWILDTYHSGYSDVEDIARIIGDATFRCHITYASDAKERKLWRQKWNTMQDNGHGGDLFYLFYRPGLRVTSVRAALILQDYVATFVTSGIPTTSVKNPPGFRQPAPYKQQILDGRVQYFDSAMGGFPKVWRGESEMEEICRVWQSMTIT